MEWYYQIVYDEFFKIHSPQICPENDTGSS